MKNLSMPDPGFAISEILFSGGTFVSLSPLKKE